MEAISRICPECGNQAEYPDCTSCGHDFTKPKDEDILAGAVDPAAEILETHIRTIKDGIAKLKDDPGAVLTNAMGEAWTRVYQRDPAEFERLRKAAKDNGARVTEIDKLIGARNRVSSGGKVSNYFVQNTSYPSHTGVLTSQNLDANENGPGYAQNS